MDKSGAVLTVTVGEISTALDGSFEQRKWNFLSPEQRTKITERVYEELVSSDVIWRAYHRAIEEAMDAEPTPDEPWCNHDPEAVADGVCECGTVIERESLEFIRRVDFTVGGV